MSYHKEVQQLAKQHGIKANMKTVEMETALRALGVPLPKKRGLSVRDTNEMEDLMGDEAKKPPSQSLPKPKPVRKSLALFFDENENDNEENQRARENKPPRKSQTVALPQYRMMTRRSAELQAAAAAAAAEELSIRQEMADDAFMLQENPPSSPELDTSRDSIHSNDTEDEVTFVQDEDKDGDKLAMFARLVSKRDEYRRILENLDGALAAYDRQVKLQVQLAQIRDPPSM